VGAFGDQRTGNPGQTGPAIPVDVCLVHHRQQILNR
jgi:hypothetical protein